VGTSHKALAGEPAIVAAYYQLPYALFVVCLMNESHLMMRYVLSDAVKGAVWP
jgi:hypothetical protein